MSEIADIMREVLPEERLADSHPVPHPGCTDCDPAFMRSRLAHLGFPRRVRREVQLVAIEPGGAVLAVFGKGAP